MRYVCHAAAALSTVFCFVSPLLGQGGQGLSIANYQFVSQEIYSRTQSYFTYRADLVNTGPSRTAVTATLTSLVPSIQLVPGQASLHFGPVPANGRVTSTDTFTVLVDRTFAFDFANLQWSFLAPLANAGRSQTVAVGTTVNPGRHRLEQPEWHGFAVVQVDAGVAAVWDGHNDNRLRHGNRDLSN